MSLLLLLTCYSTISNSFLAAAARKAQCRPHVAAYNGISASYALAAQPLSLSSPRHRRPHNPVYISLQVLCCVAGCEERARETDTLGIVATCLSAVSPPSFDNVRAKWAEISKATWRNTGETEPGLIRTDEPKKQHGNSGFATSCAQGAVAAMSVITTRSNQLWWGLAWRTY
ncbi:hypothetical protein BCON_0077g00230 [Botryotinia convoluta]|uniref:Uncharacterized protein n=1 Tax=Botryotinia convoluta TaxID=54673 RepID=A0A4Z1I4C9_9HELO|nr:hypothetical protein BCON_0077g00230 [Botryotinia convoluta]